MAIRIIKGEQDTMGLISNIYNAPIERSGFLKEHESYVVLRYKNREYVGAAFVHPDDEDFASEKVGHGIALSRARIEILKDEKERLQQEYIDKMRMYNDVLGYGAKKSEEVDPTGAFKKSIKRTYDRYLTLVEFLKEEEKGLDNYLKGQDEIVTRLKRNRRKGQN